MKKNFLWLVPPLLSSPIIWAAEVSNKLSDIDVIDTAPLRGLELKKEQIAGNVQTATDEDIKKTNAVNITDFMNRNLGSVYVNDIQGNGFQPDINYRGYTASPLSGTPQGLSIYMDGVRLNQPFGDVVSWDLIPKSAIANMSMMSGSNPLFGRNTLGGALVLKTKDGKNNAGTTGQAIVGNYGRYGFEFEHGGANEAMGLDWFLTGNFYKDQGWRESSPSEVRQIFGKAGWSNDTSNAHFTTAYVDNNLYGNGLQEQRFMDKDYESVYTKPDVTANRSLFLNLEGEHHFNDKLLFSGNAYYRNIRTRTFNGDINEGSLNQNTLGALDDDAINTLRAAGYNPPPADTIYTAQNSPFPYWSCLNEAYMADNQGEGGEKCNGLLNRTTTNQENWGTSGQLVLNDKLFGQKNSFLFGGAYDESFARFQQSTQLGYLLSDRSVQGIPFYADGVTGGVVDGEPFDNRVELNGRTRTFSFFLEDTLSIADVLHITASGRYNYTRINNKDNITAAGNINSLTGQHSFDRFNPAIGLTYNPMKELNFYAGYNEGSRAPTTIELGCANPDNPCKLPNAMAGDPPLKQVVTKTWEAGFRGHLPWNMDWHLGYFHAENKNDIMFVADDQNGFGYFKNFGKTQRQGIEASFDQSINDNLKFGANYTYLDATYQSTEIVNGTANSSSTRTVNDGGEIAGTITVRPNDKIPLIPEHMFKTYVDYQFTPEWGMNVNVIGYSGVYARGNENNAHNPLLVSTNRFNDNRYLSSGKTNGYTITNLGIRYSPSFIKGLQITGQVNNLFDQHYVTAAQLGPTGFDSNGNYISRPYGGSLTNGYAVTQGTFYSPGAPRMFWFGMRYSF